MCWLVPRQRKAPYSRTQCSHDTSLQCHDRQHGPPLQAQADDTGSNARPLSTAARNKQLASRMRSVLADNRAAYNSLRKETALFR